MSGNFAADGWIRSLAEFGLTWLGQSSALLALGLAAGRLLRRSGPAVQSVAYRTTLAAVLVCPVASTILARLGVDGITLRLPDRAQGDSAPTPAPIAPAIVAEAVESPRPSPDALASEFPPSSPSRGFEAKVVPVLPPTPKVVPSPKADWLASGILIGLGVWALGTGLLAFRLAVGIGAMVRLRRSAIPAGSAAESLCQGLASRMKLASPDVLRAPFLHSPCVDGLRRPAILLPDDPDLDLRDTFVHELAHLARLDVWWNLLRHSLSALLWFQPLVWVLSRRMEVTAEEVCDDYVVQFGADRASYAGLLLDLAGRSLPPASLTALGLISLRSLLSRRVVRILDSSRVLSTRAGGRALLLILLAGLAGTTFAGLLGVGTPRAVEGRLEQFGGADADRRGRRFPTSDGRRTGGRPRGSARRRRVGDGEPVPPERGRALRLGRRSDEPRPRRVRRRGAVHPDVRGPRPCPVRDPHPIGRDGGPRDDRGDEPRLRPGLGGAPPIGRRRWAADACPRAG